MDIYIPTKLAEIFNAPIDLTKRGIEIDLEETQTYKWSGAKLQQSVGTVVPVIYGRHHASGNLINAYIEEGENETLNMLIAVCEGEVESITNIEINGNPIEYYFNDNPDDPYGKNAEVAVRTGRPDQAPIAGFGDLHNYTEVGQILTNGAAFEFDGLITDAEGFMLELEIDRLIQLDTNQTVLAWYVALQVEYKRYVDPPSAYIFMGVYEINKKTNTLFKRWIKSPYLPPDRYSIRITKVSSDEDNINYFGKVYLASVDEIRTQNLAYPSTAVIGLRLLAMQSLSGALSNVTCIVAGRKVRIPKVTYDPGGTQPVDWEDYYWDPNEAPDGRFKTYWNDAVVYWDGTTYYEAFSANPVWCLRDLLLNDRYGLGDFIKTYHLNDTSFLASALYCEEGVDNLANKKEKRFRLDIVLDTDQKASDAIAQMLRSFRGLMDTSNGLIRISIEKQADPVYLFSVGNIIKDSFSITYMTTQVPNVLSVDFTNKDKNFQRDRLEVGDEETIKRGESIRNGNLQLIGCTRVSQVLREARIQLSKYKANKAAINFQAYIDATLIQPNDVFEFQHELPAWGDGGRLLAGSTTSVIMLDKEVTIEINNTYEIMIKNSDDDTIETRIINESPGTYSIVHVTTPFTFTPQAYDVWALGVVEESVQQYRAVNVQRFTSGIVNIAALEYVPDIYDPSGIVMPEDNYVHLSLAIPDVTDLILREKTSRSPDGSVSSQIDVSFKKPITTSKWVKQATMFEIHLSDDNTKSWTLVGRTDKEYFVIPDNLTANRIYWVAVVSITENGDKDVPSTSPRASIVLAGWQRPPADIANLAYEFEKEIVLTWDANTEEDLAGYEVRYNDYNWGTNDSYLLFRGNAQKFVQTSPIAREDVIFYVRAYNTAGIYSAKAATIEPINAPPSATTLNFTSLFQKVFLTWTAINEPDIVGYEIWRNSSEAFKGGAEYKNEYDQLGDEEMVARVTATSAVMDVPWNPTYFRIRGIDAFGGGVWSNIIQIYQVLIGPTDIDEGIIRAEHIQTGTINASHIATGSILAQHIAANQITAEHLQVSSLSALSADIGYIIAGTLVGALIKTSEEVFRTELDKTGLYSYNEAGTLVVKLSQGELCMIDPLCCQFYSKFDAGQLKFYTPYDEIPHVKRLQSGVELTGASVVLCRWYEQPHIMVGLKRLLAYHKDFSASCQEWCVYASDVRCYDNGGSDFGWKFDVHAKLVVTGGTRPENILDFNFGTAACTGICTCAVIIKENFQAWCNDISPSNYQYARICFRVLYKPLACAVWTCCDYSYDQPAGTVEELRNCVKACQTIYFGASNLWCVKIEELSRQYIMTELGSGTLTCCLCCYIYSCDQSYWTGTTTFRSCLISHSVTASGKFGTSQQYSKSCGWYDVLSFGSVGCATCCVSLCYSLSGVSQGGSVVGQYGGGGSGTFNTSTNYCSGSFISAVGVSTALSASAGARYWEVRKVFPGVTIIWWGWAVDSNTSTAKYYFSACLKYCFKCCQVRYYTCCYWYKHYTGPACSCNVKRFYSMTDITGQECILDPSGDVSYLAVAYS